jgi:cytidine deaminase
MCRQVIREFFPLNAPIIMLSSEYPREEADVPEVLRQALLAHDLVQGSESSPELKQEQDAAEWTKYIKIMTLEELLPMSFGPDQLSQAK